MPPHRHHPTGRSGARRRFTGVVMAGAMAVLVSGCVGQQDRNDDHVGPFSYRPDNREHTMAGDGPAPGGPAAGSVG